MYLLHFDRPYKHAKHYLGFVESPAGLEERLERHRRGYSARLMAVLKQEGIGFSLVRTWLDGDRKEERRLKRTKSMPKYCPVCCARKNIEAALRRGKSVVHQK